MSEADMDDAERKRRPAFQFYPGEDLLLDRHCVLMDVEALGAHMRLYAHAWERVTLPKDFAQLARLAGVSSEKKMRSLWSQIGTAWAETDDGWRHPGLDAKRAKLEEYVAKQRANGKQGGRPRKQSQDEARENPNETQPLILGSAKKRSSSSSSTSSSEQNPPSEGAHAWTMVKGKRKWRPTRSVPEDFVPLDDDLAEAGELLGHAGAQLALANFRDHEFRVAKTHWDSAFRTWFRNDAARRPLAGAGPGANGRGGAPDVRVIQAWEIEYE